MAEPLSAELEALEWLRQEQAVREAELERIKYAIFTVRQEIAGHMQYPQTDAVRQEIARHERHLAELIQDQAARTQQLAEISQRIRKIREAIEVQR